MDRLVETASGKVRGRRLDGVDVFLGVPFAAPPVGERRFRPPAPVTPWTGVRDCLEYGPIPPQGEAGPIDPVMGVGGRPQDEDCLTLNVWTPACDDARRPVLVWLYGGGFSGGCSAAPWSEGLRLAARDAVVVTCNYRVGALGFLYLAPTLGEPYLEAGNVGLLDTVAALQWVKENVASFGGDPDRVTVFGESAGGVAAALLLTVPAARGLFHRAVVESGGLHTAHEDPAEADRVTGVVLEELGLTRAEAAKLVDVPVDELLAAQLRTLMRLGSEQFGKPPEPKFTMSIQPVADGVVVPGPGPLLDAVAAGSPDVELLVGWNRDELNLSGHLMYGTELPQEVLDVNAASIFGGDAAGKAALDVYRAQFPDATPMDLFLAIETDRCVRIPITRLAEHHPGPAYSYWFTLEGTGMGTVMGPAHSLEIPFVFDNLDAAGVETMLGPTTPEGRTLAARMSSAWVAFAADGVPAHPDLPAWPSYEDGDRRVMELCAQPRVVADPEGDRRRLWEGVQ